MKPILYEDIPLDGLGLGTLADAITCEVTHEVNGVYDLKATYPVTGIHYDEIQNDRIILAKPDILSPDQMFRIYRVTKPINGVVSIYAHHVAYDMSGFIVNPFSATDLSGALTASITNAVPNCPFTLESPRTVAIPLIVKEPLPLWQLLGGTSGSFLDTYGGEWDFNDLTATLRSRLGTDRGVSVRYGKNMTDLEQDASLEATYKGVYPYWYDEEGNVLVNLPEKIIEIPGGVGKRIMILDLSGEWEEAPTVAELRTRAERYIHDNKVGEPKITWKVKFVDLSQSGENLAVLEQVMLGDDVTVVYEELGVNASSRVVKTEFDTLGERYLSVTLGRVKQNLAKILAGTKDEIKEAISVAKVGLERAVDHATDFITNGSGYMRFIYDGDELKEIVSLDHPDIDQAQSVWRWNNGGFGHSSTGYNGPYTTAITQDGSIVADFITTGNLNANRVQVTGILTDELGRNYWNMATGEFVLRNGRINISTNPETSDFIKLNGLNYATTTGNWQYLVWGKATADLASTSAYLQSAGLGMRQGVADDGSGGIGRLWLGGFKSSGGAQFYGLNFYDANGSGRSRLFLGESTQGNYNLTISDANNNRWRINEGQITGWNASGTQSIVIGNTGYSYFGTGGQGHTMHIRSNTDAVDGVCLNGPSGKVTFKDTSTGFGGELSSDHLWLTDAQGNVTAQYPRVFVHYQIGITLNSQAAVVTDARVSSSMKVFLQALYYPGDPLNYIFTAQPLAGKINIYARRADGVTIPDGTVVDINVLIIGGING